MSFENKKAARKKILYIIFFALCLLSALLIFTFTNDSRKFNHLTAKLFVSELSADTLSLHYTLAYPENYDLAYNAVLPIYHTESDGQEALEEMLIKLSRISPENLNENDAFTYRLLTSHLQQQLEGAAFPYYSEPLSPSSGMQSGLPILLADYTFRSREDVEDYLKLLDQTDSYFEGLALYEKEKAENGLFMSDASVEKVMEQCSSIMDENALASGDHFLHATFEERVSQLEKNGLITPEEKAKYISENDRLLTTVMAPAYEALGDNLILLKGSGTNDMGLCYFPEGAAYYEQRLTSVTGSGRSIAELKQMLYNDFQKNYAALLSLTKKYPDLASCYDNAAECIPFSTPAEMLEDLRQRIQKDFPAFPKGTLQFVPACTIKNVSHAMENYSSPAYYLTPPIDDMSSNIIYINQKNMPDSLTLYTTLAHEGYPGHLYQTVYSQQYMQQQNTDPIRYLLHYGGYVEGWALYVENLSYGYAGALAAEDSELIAAWYEACRLNRNIQLCMYSLLDIAIHYEGATPAQVQKILGQIGITSPETAASIYQYIVEEPATYPKYYVGYLEFLALRDEAAALWGADFTLRNFHQFVLETGPCDFTTLHDQLYASSSDIISSR